MNQIETPDELPTSPTISNTEEKGEIPDLIKKEAYRVMYNKWVVFVILCIITGIIFSFPWIYENCIFRIEGLQKLQTMTDEKFSASFLLSIYLFGKTFGFLFLFSLFIYVAKIFDNLRRLEIIYRDKALAFRNISILYYDAQVAEVEKYYDFVFEPTLQQAEKQKPMEQRNNQHLGDALASLIEKITELLKKK